MLDLCSLQVRRLPVAARPFQRLQHTQLLPGLTLVRTKLVRRGRGAAAVTFKVLDAGDAVAGARVRAGGRSSVTGAVGTATLARSTFPISS